jgi:hypothetical protein
LQKWKQHGLLLLVVLLVRVLLVCPLLVWEQRHPQQPSSRSSRGV